MQVHHKCLVFRARQTMLDSSEHRRYVTTEHCGSIEPQTGEDLTTKYPLRIWH